jgi:cobalt/nickel transport protein
VIVGRFICWTVGFLVVVCPPTRPLQAHFGILQPQSALAPRDKPVSFLYTWGHPFEHQLFDATRPESVVVLAPDGKRTELGRAVEKTTIATPEKKNVTAYRFQFTPGQRGDFTFVLTAAPLWMEAEREFYQDTVKVVLHVLAQRGWDNPVGRGFELVPLTRPYGLQPGMVFQAQALVDGKPLAGAMVEVERYNPAPPKVLPPDEQITRRVKTDPNGVLTCTLTEAGWWCVTAERDGGQRERGGKKYPLRQRTTFWVFVDTLKP